MTTYKIVRTMRPIYPHGMTKLQARLAGQVVEVPINKFRVQCQSSESAWETGTFDSRAAAEEWLRKQND